MKKIININLSGRVIPIEDTAYDSLQRYIESLRRYFAHEEGRDEIINDIESRIAELMNDRLKKGAACITEADLEDIIQLMGRVEDFEQAEGDTSAAFATESTTTEAGSQKSRRFTGRLYRDADDKILGGVCAGIANYINVDPAIVRLVFALITFGGFGFGIFIYILLWIILPVKPLEAYVGKRLFRNPDDRIIGGVAGGLAAYFNKSAWAIRLIFAAPILLNILFNILHGIFSPYGGNFTIGIATGTLTGTFIVTYIILWIVLPEAKSPYEKMEMRGEKVDINTIRQNVKEGMDTFKSRMQSWGQEVKASAQDLGGRAKEFTSTTGGQFASEVNQTTRPVRNGLTHALGVIIKAFFLFVFGSIAFGLLMAIIVLLFGGGAAIWPTKQSLLGFALNGFWQYFFFWGTVVLFLLVPVVAFVTWLVRRLMRVRSRRHYLGYVFGGLWFLGILCAAGLASALVKDAVRKGEVAEALPITQPANGRMIVRIDEPEVLYSGDLWFIDEGEGWDLTEDTLKLTDIKIRVLRSDDTTNYSVLVHKLSRGRSRAAARQRASNIVYNTSYADSVLLLGSGLAIDKSSKYRGQKVLVEIKVPVGKKIRFDRSVEEKLDPVRIRMMGRNEDRRWRRDRDVDWYDDTYFEYKTDVDYVMMPDGELREAGVSDSTVAGEGENAIRVGQISADQDFEVETDKAATRRPGKERRGTYATPLAVPFVPTIL